MRCKQEDDECDQQIKDLTDGERGDWAITQHTTLGDSCVPATVNYLQYHVTGSTPMVVRPFHLPAPQSGTLSRILSGTRLSVQTVSEVCFRRICLLDTSALTALDVL